MRNSLQDVVIPSDEDLPGLYVHVPFCRKKCGYCNFFSITDIEQVDAFLSALYREIEISLPVYQSEFNSIYVGGGTPSVLDAKQISCILRKLKEGFSVNSDAEITVEINPSDLTPSLLTDLGEAGVNRINIGIQSFEDGMLMLLGRQQSGAQARAALEIARSFPHFSVGLDLIYCIPGQTLDSWITILTEAVSYKPDHISCYELTLEEDSPMAKRCREEKLQLPNEENKMEFFFKTSEYLEASGYVQYEVSNFALPNKESRHNSKYWNHTPYLGFGPAAHSFWGRKRRWNHSCLPRYINDLKSRIAPVAGTEELTDDQLILETLFLGFRTKRGIDLNLLRTRYGFDLISEKKSIISRLVDKGFLTLHDGHLKSTRKGLAVADSLAQI